MLQTTVNYLDLLERKRHNLVSEKQNQYQLSLNARDTAVREGSLAESIRHNEVTESQGWASIIETTRHNMATESINAYDATTRRMQIPIAQQQADAATMNAFTNRYAAEQQAGIGWANVAVNQLNAETRSREADNAYENYQHNWGYQLTQSQAAVRNAETNRMNAETRQKEYDWNVTYGTQNLEISQQNADTTRMDVVWRNLINTVSTGADILQKNKELKMRGWETLFGKGSLKPSNLLPGN